MNRSVDSGAVFVKHVTNQERVIMTTMVWFATIGGKTKKLIKSLGQERDHSAEFKNVRKNVVGKELLEVSRLEKRLTRLTQLLASLPPEQLQSGTSKRWPLAWQNDDRKSLEQSVVTWEEDANVPACPFCQQEFSSYTFRRHHCRTCGRVVCGDPATQCSSEIGLNIAPSKIPYYINPRPLMGPPIFPFTPILTKL